MRSNPEKGEALYACFFVFLLFFFVFFLFYLFIYLFIYFGGSFRYSVRELEDSLAPEVYFQKSAEPEFWMLQRTEPQH